MIVNRKAVRGIRRRLHSRHVVMGISGLSDRGIAPFERRNADTLVQCGMAQRNQSNTLHLRAYMVYDDIKQTSITIELTVRSFGVE